MSYKNATIDLTISLEGCLAARGKFESEVKVTESGKVFEIWKNPLTNITERIPVYVTKTTQLPMYHVCEIHTTLGEHFCNYSISDDARPKKTVSVPYWNKLSPKNKLKLAVQQYVWDLYGREAKFSFQIME